MGFLKIAQVEPPDDMKDPKVWGDAIKRQYYYSTLGLILGLVCIIGGIVLFFHGVGGSTSWTAKFLGLESKLSDAAPGTILFVVGLFVVWATKFDVKSRKK